MSFKLRILFSSSCFILSVTSWLLSAGNYDQFVKTREEKEDEQEKRYKAEQDQIKHMKNYVAKFGQGALNKLLLYFLFNAPFL